MNKKNNVRYVFFLVFLYSGLFNSVFAAASQLPKKCQLECVSPYGELLGKSKRGVKAYSNCNSDCVIFEPNKFNNTYTGIKWQCVEYARRWLLINKGAVYGDVDIASDIWNKINSLTDVVSKKKIPIKNYLNGSKQAPQVGDLLIYAKAFNDTGHVAIVIDVDLKGGIIEVGEQNYNNKVWNGDFSRKVNLIKKNDVYWLLDKYLLGWKHLDKNN